MKKGILNKKVKALTLMELMISMVILGFLVLAAWPILMPLIYKAKSLEAQLQLEHVHTLEKSYFYMNSKYSTNFPDISYEHAKLATQGGTANYQIEIVEATNNTFRARATAVTDFDGDGVFSVWEVDQDKNVKEVTPD